LPAVAPPAAEPLVPAVLLLDPAEPALPGVPALPPPLVAELPAISPPLGRAGSSLEQLASASAAHTATRS
jgi:hypothetical protein